MEKYKYPFQFKNTNIIKLSIFKNESIFFQAISKNTHKHKKGKINLMNTSYYNINEIAKYSKDKFYNKKEGFYNLGSTCYLNSFIQILIHIPGFILKLKEYKDKIKKNSLLYWLFNVAEKPSKENLYELRAQFIKNNSNYKYHRQEDSQEFGTEFLKTINKELSELNLFFTPWKLEKCFDLKNVFKPKLDELYNLMKKGECDFEEQTIINYFFYYYEVELVIRNNKILRYNFYGDIDNQLSFDIKNNYRDQLTLNEMIENKYLYGNNKLLKLPVILDITLLRALIEEPKITTKVLIYTKIDLKDFLDKDFGEYFLSTEYILYALNVCLGSNKRSGHYYSYILINDAWYKFDDLNVNEVTKKSIEEDLEYIYGIYYINKDYLIRTLNKE